MGLDCVPFGVAKPGHEDEWNEIMEDWYAGRQVSEERQQRRVDISIGSYEVVGAPIVGTHPEADAWALSKKSADSDDTDEQFLQKLEGYRVLDLVCGTCPGVPKYSNGGLYEGVDETSFRGQLLNECEDIIGSELLVLAWTEFMRPEDAVEYGEALLDAARRARSVGRSPDPPTPPDQPKGLFGRLFGRTNRLQSEETLSFDEKLDVIVSAGNWYKYWGERGFPIWEFLIS